jgi:Rod binding domain-containing protein
MFDTTLPVSSMASFQSDLAFAQKDSAAAKLTGSTNDPTALKTAAQNFESVFLSQMFSQMFKDVGTDTVFGGGQGEEMFRSLLLDEYAKQVAKRGGLGIGDAVMRTLISQQEKKQ